MGLSSAETETRAHRVSVVRDVSGRRAHFDWNRATVKAGDGATPAAALNAIHLRQHQVVRSSGRPHRDSARRRATGRDFYWSKMRTLELLGIQRRYDLVERARAATLFDRLYRNIELPF
jgi:hypothetical protein